MAERSIKSMRQRPDQTAADFRDAIQKWNRRYGSAFDQEDVIEVFLRGVDTRLTSVPFQWTKLAEEAEKRSSGESSRRAERAKAFQDLVRYADGQRTWDKRSPRSREHRRSDSRDHPVSPVSPIDVMDISAITDVPPTVQLPPDLVEEVRKRREQFPDCPQAPTLIIPKGRRDINIDVIRHVNGGRMCYVCNKSKIKSADNPNPHETTACGWIPSDPVKRYEYAESKLRYLSTLRDNIRKRGQPGQQRTGSYGGLRDNQDYPQQAKK